MEILRVSYETLRNIEIFQNLSNFEIIFWLLLIIFYLYRKYVRKLRK